MLNEAQARRGVSSHGYGSDASARLGAVQVWTSVEKLLAILFAELAAQPAKGGKAGAMLLDEGEVCRSPGKALCIALQVGNVLGLHDGDAFWGCPILLFGRAGRAKENCLRRILYR